MNLERVVDVVIVKAITAYVKHLENVKIQDTDLSSVGLAQNTNASRNILKITLDEIKRLGRPDYLKRK